MVLLLIITLHWDTKGSKGAEIASVFVNIVFPVRSRGPGSDRSK